MAESRTRPPDMDDLFRVLGAARASGFLVNREYQRGRISVAAPLGAARILTTSSAGSPSRPSRNRCRPRASRTPAPWSATLRLRSRTGFGIKPWPPALAAPCRGGAGRLGIAGRCALPVAAHGDREGAAAGGRLEAAAGRLAGDELHEVAGHERVAGADRVEALDLQRRRARGGAADRGDRAARAELDDPAAAGRELGKAGGEHVGRALVDDQQGLVVCGEDDVRPPGDLPHDRAGLVGRPQRAAVVQVERDEDPGGAGDVDGRLDGRAGRRRERRSDPRHVQDGGARRCARWSRSSGCRRAPGPSRR